MIRSSTDSRCQPRSSPAKAWISSTITARRFRTELRASTFGETSITSSDSGVVSRQSGGSRRMSLAGGRGHVAVPEGRPPAQSVQYRWSRTSRLLSRALIGQM